MLTLPEKLKPFIQLIVRLWIGGLFTWSGVTKLNHFEAFEKAALNYHILPETLTKIYALMLPWVEILAGGYLMLGLFTHFAALLVILMMASFIIAIGAALFRGDDLDCGCFVGGKTEPVTPKKLVEDFILLGFSIYLFIVRPGFWSVDNFLRVKEAEEIKKEPTPSPDEENDS